MLKWFSRGKRSGTLDQAIDDLERALSRSVSFDRLRSYMQGVSDAVRKADQAELQSGMERLATNSEHGNLAAASTMILCLGMLVEAGGDARTGNRAVLTRCKEAFQQAILYQRAVTSALTEASNVSGAAPSEKQTAQIADRVAKTMPEASAAANLLGFFTAPLLAFLTRNKEMRMAAIQDKDFVNAACEAVSGENSDARSVYTILRVLEDEELLVLYPLYRKGFRVQISGITHNFQLHTLLADAIMETHIPGERPDPRVVAAARDKPYNDTTPVAQGRFHLHNWTAVESDATVTSDPFTHLIWHEGMPADIPMFEGTRIVVLAPPPFIRTWKAPRDFETVVGDLKLVGVLDEKEVSDWLGRLGSAPKPEEVKTATE